MSPRLRGVRERRPHCTNGDYCAVCSEEILKLVENLMYTNDYEALKARVEAHNVEGKELRKRLEEYERCGGETEKRESIGHTFVVNVACLLLGGVIGWTLNTIVVLGVR